MSEAYRVHVVDPHYGEQIRDLPAGEPVWTVDSPDNHPVIARIWKDCPDRDHLTGITSFKFNADTAPADWLISELSTIAWHHDEESHDPPYSILNVIGVEWSEKIQEELSRFGFDKHEETRRGFVARRKLDVTERAE